MRGAIAALGLALGMGWAARVEAEPGATAVRLRWDAPASCPSQDEVRLRLEQALAGHDVVPSVEATIEGEPGRFTGQVVLRGPWGETTRSLDSRSCSTLADAVVLLASVSARDHERTTMPEVPEPVAVEPAVEDEPVAVEPAVEDEPVEDEAAGAEPSAVSEAEEPSEPEPKSGPVVARSDAEPSARAVEVLARAEARVGGGMLMGVDLGAGVALGIEGKWLRVEAVAAGWLPRQREVAPAVDLDLRSWTGELRGCGTGPLPSAPWLRPFGCAGLEVGVLRAEGRGDGLADARAVSRTWVAATISPGVVFRPWRRVGFVLGGSLVVPLRTLRFTLGGAGEVHRSSRVAGRGFAGVEVHFP